ncbi:MAG: MarR family transcriptional regulator [Eubacteriales bacterium]|nr:MarR family transcriptional regulator [Eubacteriales bacterium]
MLERNFATIYTKFKMRFYGKVFNHFENREASLSAVEVFCVEVIYALGRPTVNEFATFANISPPNAAYKINSLIKKGYVKKIRSETDKREYYLEVTKKYLDYYGITYDYISVVMKRIRERFPEEDVEKLDDMLDIIINELMPEVKINRTFEEIE